MENKDFARIFSRIAQILEIQGGNPFRIRSFERSAQILEDLPFRVEDALAGDLEQLASIPGIGEGTISKIREIAATGSCRELEKLAGEVPPSLLELLKIQNLGPKKIQLFWKKLGVTDLESLEAAARTGRLRQLSGMGEKSEQKILQAIEFHKRRHGRCRLDQAERIGESLIELLKSKSPVRQVAVAGSLRRRCETVGDIDVLATCDQPERAIEVFVAHPERVEVLAQGPTKASIRLENGLTCDLRVVADESFGAAMQYFTGSKAHNVVLRERAKRQGFKINEYGLFQVEDESRVAGDDEREIYRKLGLLWMPPELRENRGEIEAAEKELPRLLEIADLKGDLHMHTLDSDGRSDLGEMAGAARELGYHYIAVTDHSKALAMTGGLDEARLAEQARRIDRFNESDPGIIVLKGIEVDILEDGSLDLSDEALASLDVVVASVHSALNQSRNEMTARLCRALEHPAVNVLGHPTGRLLLQREGGDLDLEEILRKARDNRVFLEINSLPKRLDLNDVQVRMARDMGVALCVNSDAHHRDSLALARFGVDVARRGWLGPEAVLNTLPLKELRRRLAKEVYP